MIIEWRRFILSLPTFISSHRKNVINNMNLLPFISLVSLTPSSLGFLSQWSERSELGEWRDVTSPLHMMKGMRKDINNNNKIYKIFFQLLLLLFMSFPTHSLLSHLATLTGRRERVWRRNRETDGTVKWDERETGSRRCAHTINLWT